MKHKKRKISFTWHEKSFFLLGLMAATFFFAWAGMLGEPNNRAIGTTRAEVLNPEAATPEPYFGEALNPEAATPEPSVANGTLLIIKKTGRDGDGTFAFSVAGPKNFNFSIKTDKGSGEKAYTVPPGNYTITETTPEGWKLKDSTCSNGSPDTGVKVTSGIKTSCTFNNEKNNKVFLKILKIATGGNGRFDFVLKGPNTNEGFGITTKNGFGDYQIDILPEEEYTLKEIVPFGWRLKKICGSETNPVTIKAKEGQNFECTVNNERI